jgi:multicomponent Na+:H+ antiporter subunit E
MRLRTRVRFRWQGRTTGALALVWVLLWGHVNLVTIGSGILVGYLVSVVFPLPAVHFHGRLRPLGAVRLVVRLLAQLVSASLTLVRYSLRRRVELRPGIVRVDLTCPSDLVQVMTAAMVSLVPGTIVVEARRTERRLYLHVFDLPDAGAADRERRHALAAERLVLQSFGSDADLERSAKALAAGKESS